MLTLGIRSTVDFLLSPTHRLVVKLSTLFLKLVVTDIKGISAKTVIAHSELVVSTEIQTRILLRHILINEIELIIIICTASSSVCRIRVIASTEELLLSTLCWSILVKTVVAISIAIRSIIVDVVRRILAIRLH